MDKLVSGAAKMGIHLTTAQIEQFERYYRELMDWNQRINLTAITAYEEVQVKHFLDALTVSLACPLDLKTRNPKVIDIGTGAGMPGIPVKIVYPEIKLVLLESVGKKTNFLRYIINILGLSDVEIITARSEETAHQAAYREQFNIVLSRAVAALPALVELTLPFCGIGGRLIAPKKGDISQEVDQAARAIKVMGGHLLEIKNIALEGLERYCLVIIEKVSTTPPQYPRLPGTPAKNPLLPFANDAKP